MRSCALLLFLACGSPTEPLPCGCDELAAAEGRLCPRLSQAELEAVRGEVGPGWESCPPLPAD